MRREVKACCASVRLTHRSRIPLVTALRPDDFFATFRTGKQEMFRWRDYSIIATPTLVESSTHALRAKDSTPA